MKTTEGPFSAASGFFDAGNGTDVDVALANGLKAVGNYREDQERRFYFGPPEVRYEDGFLTRRQFEDQGYNK